MLNRSKFQRLRTTALRSPTSKLMLRISCDISDQQYHLTNSKKHSQIFNANNILPMVFLIIQKYIQWMLVVVKVVVAAAVVVVVKVVDKA